MEVTRNIYFYEWSDIDRKPMSFLTEKEFVEFCNVSNITLNKRNLNFLNENNNVYATCKNGRNELIMSGDYKNLRKNYSKHRNG